MNTHFKSLIAVVAAAIALSLFPQNPAFGDDYIITDLGTFGGTKSEAWGINNQGQVVGRAFLSGDVIYHAFLYSPAPEGGGVMTDLGLANCTDPNGKSWAYRINDSSQIAGVSCFWVSGNHNRAFLYSGGIMQQLGTLGGGTSDAKGINNSGHVVGIGATPSDATTRAFFYDGVTMKDLGTLWGENESGAYGINDSDQVVGASRYSATTDLHAFLYQNNGMIDLTPTLSSSVAYDINNAGKIVGRAIFSGTIFHAFLYSDGVLTDLGALLPGGLRSEAGAINNQGQIVGWFELSGIAHAFLYENGAVTDLNTRLPGGSGWLLNYASDINDDGHIVGWGTINGQSHAFLMTPLIGLSPATLSNGVVGTAYNQTITASGGTPPYTFTVTAGAVPTGLALSSSGELSGTPTTAGAFSFTVRATDANGSSGSKAYSINISIDKAVMTTPVPGTTLTSSMVTFTWSAANGASEYHLQVGTTLGGQDLYSLSQGLNLSVTVMSLPTDGRSVYVRLWSKIADVWSYDDYTYTSCSGCTATKAAMTTPAPGSTLSSSMTTFWWSASLGSECYLQVGTTLGGQEIYSAGQGTNLSVQVPMLPTDGSPVYARLWTNIGGAWLYNDYTYTACTGCTATKAVMTTPAPGSTLTSSMTTFGWSGSLASECYLQVGTTPGGQELYTGGQGTGLSAPVGELPTDGSTVYVRLWSNVGGAWWYNDYTYATCSGCVGTRAVMTTPAPGATLTSTAVTFTWSTSLASECYLQVGTTLGGQEVYSAGQGTDLSTEVMDLPNNGSTVYARLWSNVGGAWAFKDYSYTACTGCTTTKAAMVTPAPGSTLSSQAVIFTWSASLASEYYLFVGTTAGGQEIYSAGQGTNLSVEVNGLHDDGSPVYVRLWSRIGGAWLSNDYTYTACTGCK